MKLSWNLISNPEKVGHPFSWREIIQKLCEKEIQDDKKIVIIFYIKSREGETETERERVKERIESVHDKNRETIHKKEQKKKFWVNAVKIKAWETDKQRERERLI